MVSVEGQASCLPTSVAGPQAPTAVACGTIPSLAEQACELIDRVVGRWWVLHTRARCEKVVAATLERMGITYYLPLRHVERTYGRRRLTFFKPLFPGYLFMCGDSTSYDLVARGQHIANILHVEDQDRLRKELRQIVRVVESGEPVDLYPSIREGRRCRVTSGSLKGVEGIVLRRRGRSRMYISATVLGQSAVIEVDSALLEAAE
ncbi:MAG: UpxY family transcription antiterminator [Phycisphaerae bacterium]|nr:UpxY family transcription antiterminator [Phycisphaerae bacterium]